MLSAPGARDWGTEMTSRLLERQKSGPALPADPNQAFRGGLAVLGWTL